MTGCGDGMSGQTGRHHDKLARIFDSPAAAVYGRLQMEKPEPAA